MGGSSSKVEPVTPEQQVASELFKDTITTIQEIWREMRKDPEKEAEAAYKIYKKLFSSNPEYRQLFAEDMSLLVKRLIMMMGTVVENLDDLNALRTKVSALGRRHTKYNVPTEAYGNFLDAILWGLKESMGETFTPRAQYCFTVMFMWATNIMIDAGRPASAEEKAYDIKEFEILTDYESFLNDATCLEYFHLYLSTEFAEEEMLFYLDVMKYKNTRVSVAEIESKLKDLSQEIYKKYIKVDGITPVKLSVDITTSIEDSLDHPTAGMFDEAVEVVKKVMKDTRWQSFKESKTCQALCGAKSGYAKHSANVLYDITSVRK